VTEVWACVLTYPTSGLLYDANMVQDARFVGSCMVDALMLLNVCGKLKFVGVVYC